MKNNEGTPQIRYLENVHIPLWLLKDTCWLMEWKWAGVLMIIPTVTVAVYIAYITRNTSDKWMNLSILCWISANSWWMWCELFNHVEEKNLAALPFITGMVFTAVYFMKTRKRIGWIQ
jgi:hypothetical protein